MSCPLISPGQEKTIPALFRERVRQTPDRVAYCQYDVASQNWTESTWQQMAVEVGRWQSALANEELQRGDRVAIMVKNSREWIVFDQAALGMGLVTVPLYVEDRPDNVAYIINHAGIKLLVVQDRLQWKRLLSVEDDLASLDRIVSLTRISEDDEPDDPRLASLVDWVFGHGGELQTHDGEPSDLASIVYTSGTTGRSKGVMLSHTNMLSNAHMATQCADVNSEDSFLSFLPLSHTMERTVGYLVPIMLGAKVTFARSIPQLVKDLLHVRPTVMVSVPRIYEKVYGKIQNNLKQKSFLEVSLFNMAVNVGWKKFQHEQGRAPWTLYLLLWPMLNNLVASKVLEKLGGRLRIAICGGAALSPDVSRLFIGLGLPLIQGYGLTEASPVICTNRIEDNIPSSIGTVLPDVDIRIGDSDELQSRSACNMSGYWQDVESTRNAYTDDGWLKTGDKARIDFDGHVYITGRIKDIIVLSNGEKVPPDDMEMAIQLDGLFEQVMVYGEAKPCLIAVVVLNREYWADLAAVAGIHPDTPDALGRPEIADRVLKRINERLANFPGYAKISHVLMTFDAWTVDNGLLTPTLKVRRPNVVNRFETEIEQLYEKR